jgi:murein DD-endopeptidase MepM/ murein hydrolase activator NlpD
VIDQKLQIGRMLQEQLGLSQAQAAGVVGNFVRESRLNPRINEGGAVGLPARRGGYGLAQWTGSRQNDLIRFAGSDERAGDLNTQMAFLKHELQGPERRAYDSLLKAQTPEEAALVFERDFERAGIKANDERVAHARRAYEILGQGSSSGGSSAAPGAQPMAQPQAPGFDDWSPQGVDPGRLAGMVWSQPKGADGFKNPVAAVAAAAVGGRQPQRFVQDEGYRQALAAAVQPLAGRQRADLTGGLGAYNALMGDAIGALTPAQAATPQPSMATAGSGGMPALAGSGQFQRGRLGGASTNWQRDPDAEQSGFDVSKPGGVGAPIVSPVDLRVTGKGFQGKGSGETGRGYGNWLSGEFRDPSSGKRFELLLGHLNDYAVKPGDVVPAGTVLGTQGVTGRAFGAHVTTHVNALEGGDPWNVLENQIVRRWVDG